MGNLVAFSFLVTALSLFVAALSFLLVRFLVSFNLVDELTVFFVLTFMLLHLLFNVIKLFLVSIFSLLLMFTHLFMLSFVNTFSSVRTFHLVGTFLLMRTFTLVLTFTLVREVMLFTLVLFHGFSKSLFSILFLVGVGEIFLLFAARSKNFIKHAFDSLIQIALEVSKFLLLDGHVSEFAHGRFISLALHLEMLSPDSFALRVVALRVLHPVDGEEITEAGADLSAVDNIVRGAVCGP